MTITKVVLARKPLLPINIRSSCSIHHQTPTKNFYDSKKNKRPPQIRLSKRMSELDLCSRREADNLITKGLILLRGKRIDPILGQKVDFDESDISILLRNEKQHKEHPTAAAAAAAVILNKPEGYVSGQPDDGHVPAVTLLTKTNLFVVEHTTTNKEGQTIALRELNSHFRVHIPKAKVRRFPNNRTSFRAEPTLSGYAPAGRLDIDSTGLLLFTRSGVLAKKLVGRKSIDKEYLVKVRPLKAAAPSRDLTDFVRGGAYLKEDRHPLLPLVSAEWLDEFHLKLVLREGRKRQIKRMCRQLLGYEVVHLERIRIGNITLGDLPVGRWRPIQPWEVRSILNEEAGS